MPIYEFICTGCKAQFELRCSFSESDRPVRCPKCNSSARKLISSFACKMGSNIQPAENAFREKAVKEAESPLPGVLITPPPSRVELLPPPAKKSTRPGRKKK